MRYRLQFRRYRLPFRAVVRTAHGAWTEREGILVRLEDENGAVGFGEAAPIPGFGTETVDDDDAGVRSLGGWTDDGAIAGVPARLGCLRNAFASAIPPLTQQPGADVSSDANTYRAVAALLPAGRGALAQIAPKAEMGFRVYKWKVGVADLADELALLDDICAELPSGGKLRLDANGAWDRRKSERWLERCAERPIEFVEQPCLAGASDSATQRAKVEDVLLGLAGDYPTPIALDESLISEGDVERWLGAGWPGVFVVKPSLLGDVGGALTRLEHAKAKVVFSSALETAVGARAALRTALGWRGDSDSTRPSGSGQQGSSPAALALGFGVWPLFADTRFDGPTVAPFLRRHDVEQINAEVAWTALN